VQLEDGKTSPATIKKVRKAEANSWLEITIHEGRTHQVKRMLEAVGHHVLKLVRIKMGPLSLGDLAPGEFRYLEDREANALRGIVAKRSEVGGVRLEGKPEQGRRPMPRLGPPTSNLKQGRLAS
jgi:23S rRNA pseudouridine2605 synthase